MPFLRYPSIENHYRSDHITAACYSHPELKRCKYIIQEKLHGANVSFEFAPNQELQVYSRNQKVNATLDDFNGLATILATPHMKHFVDYWKEVCRSTGLHIRFFGEVFGGNIQKGVNYGKERRILFYDVVINDEFQTAKKFLELINQVVTDEIFYYGEIPSVNMSLACEFLYVVPILGIVDSLEEALTFDACVNSYRGAGLPDHKTFEAGENIMEGVVIKQYETSYPDSHGNLFYIKKKNEAFLEKSKEHKPRTDPTDGMCERVVALQDEYFSYFNEARIQSVFSKWGKITSPKEIGDYIQRVVADVEEDFVKDHGEEFEALSKTEQKWIKRVAGKLTVPLLHAHM